jgi:hypothetical protein
MQSFPASQKTHFQTSSLCLVFVHLFVLFSQGGTKLVYDRYEEGKDTLYALINFFEQLSTAETEYYKRLEKLATRTVFQEKGYANI